MHWRFKRKEGNVIKGPWASHSMGLAVAMILSLSLLIALSASPGWSETAQTSGQVPVMVSPLRLERALDTGTGVKLVLDTNLYQSLKSQTKVKITDFRIAPERMIDLELEQFSVFDDSTKFVAGTDQGDRPLPAPDVTLLQGKVAGYPDSRVFLGLSPLGCNGFLTFGEDTFILSTKQGKDKSGQPLAPVIYDRSSIQMPLSRVWCGGGIEVPESERLPRPEKFQALLAGEYKICNVAVDADWEYYSDLFGQDDSRALTYIAELIAAVSTIYDRDIQVKLYLGYARVWTTSADPYNQTGNTAEALAEFRDWWNANMWGVSRNLVHKFSGTSGGGRAYVDVLCGVYMSYGLSCVHGYFPYPIAPGDSTWDLIVVAHELGHNFGSRHTHCYDPPLDHCYNQEAGCYNGPVECSRGTIMSYCHLCLPGMSNIDVNFPSQVVDRIRFSVDLASCLNIALNPIYVDRANSGSENGTSAHPFNTVGEGIRGIIPGGTVKIRSGDYPETMTVRERMTLEKWEGATPVVIGNGSSSEK